MSAHTGGVTDEHDIISIVTVLNQEATAGAMPSTPGNKQMAGGIGSAIINSTFTLFKWILAAAFLGGMIFVGYRQYLERQTRGKRF